MENKKKIESTELYRLCNREQLFTCGDIKQYQKMFELAGNGITQTELAYILYICSKYRLEEVFETLTPLFNDSKEDSSNG